MNSKTLRHILMAALLLILAVAITGCGSQRSKRVSPTRTSKNYSVVKVRAKDTLKTLSNRYLKDPDKAWIIAAYNRIDSVKEGDIVIIPRTPINLGGIQDNRIQTVPVLAYSGFSEDVSDAITVKRSDFEAQMQFLKDKGYTPLPLDRFYDFLEFKEQAPEKAVVITIDDVGKNTFSVAYPVLQKFGYPATVFVATDLVSGKGAALSWEQIRQMHDSGIGIGHRTKTLRNLTRRQGDETLEDFVIAVDREMTVPTLQFKTEIGYAPDFFAYPFGATNEMVISLLKKNGFRGALTMGKGANPFFTNNYLVKRNSVPGNMSMAEFEKLFIFSQKGESK
ncbi:polysaccharide deacetylase family protein [Desulfovibrio ferrophilus]|uniref:Polysaccharide deacetylase n=1 Tax=Desulfovibrio ferrophilus TaxID=241368 RepID=A0A2Z6B3H5_9BACT|nr:polysaccharide deacetylase family protein [Desulfovibrio ferrophilus]BBD09988.1 Polysaccharide deacetylase [Desulfovibrio ferrophilus]